MMKGIRIGYVRVSADDQNPDRQLENINVEKIFIDKASGRDTQRPQFKVMMEFIRQGDILVVSSMDRLARNLDDLRKIVHDLLKKNIKVEFVKENLTFKGDDSPISMLMLSIMGAFAEFERSIIRERQAEGIAIAKKKGKYKGRKKMLSSDEALRLQERAKLISNKSVLAREFKVSRATIYNYLNR